MYKINKVIIHVDHYNSQLYMIVNSELEKFVRKTVPAATSCHYRCKVVIYRSLKIIGKNFQNACLRISNDFTKISIASIAYEIYAPSGLHAVLYYGLTNMLSTKFMEHEKFEKIDDGYIFDKLMLNLTPVKFSRYK